MSGSLFDIHINDTDKDWEKKNEGGAVVGKIKLFGQKFANDIASVADMREGLQSMLRDIERYSKRNEMLMNKGKTKIMVFQNGGRRKREDKWVYKGKELEILN